MTKSLTAKGTGKPDFTTTVNNMDVALSTRAAETTAQSIQNRIGTVNTSLHGTIPTKMGTLSRVSYMGRLGSLHRLGSVTQVGYVPRLGTVGRVGSVTQVGYMPRLGSVGHMGSMPYVGRVGTAHTGTVSTISTARVYSPLTMRDRVPLGAGSTWTGSWSHIGSYRVKTALFQIGNPGTTGGGSISLIAAMNGTTSAGGTFTYYGPVRIGKGSSTPISFSEALHYIRPVVRQHGGAAGRGTVSVLLGLQA